MPINRVKSEYPCFWFAKYSDKTDKLIIPKCQLCGEYLKLCDDEYICRKTDCHPKKEDINFKESKIISLDDNEIYEFDYLGNETISFRYLPINEMKIFGIVNTHSNKNEIYTINLSNGKYWLNGIEIKPSIFHNKEEIVISDKLKRYGINNDLIHFKTAVSVPGRQTYIKSFSIGYKCKIYNLNIQTMLTISTSDFTPSLYTKYSEN